MKFADIMFGLAGFLVMFLVFAVMWEIVHLILRHLAAQRRKSLEDQGLTVRHACNSEKNQTER